MGKYESCDVMWVAECGHTLVGPFNSLKEAYEWAGYRAKYGEPVAFRALSKFNEETLGASVAANK